jgi:hypothetical protein
MMKTTFGMIGALLGLAGAAEAACLGSGEAIFHCQIEGRTTAVDICLQDNVAIYRFGPMSGLPEMLLARRVEDVGYVPWTGVGRWRSETMSFDNAGTTYQISYAVDRLEPESPTLASVNVLQAGQKIAQLDCDDGAINGADFGSLFVAKEDLGLNWCRQTGEWEAVCAE